MILTQTNFDWVIDYCFFQYALKLMFVLFPLVSQNRYLLWSYVNALLSIKLLETTKLYPSLSWKTLNNAVIFHESNLKNYNPRDKFKNTMKHVRCTNKFRPFFIKIWAFIVKERNLMFYSKYYPSYCSTCVWHES